MAAIGSIYDAKELRSTYQPLLLCEFEFSNGQFFRASTHPLSHRYKGSPLAGSYEYLGNEWVPRVINQNIGATQAMSDFGFDIPPTVTVSLADPDKVVYQTYENQVGFKGAILKVYAAMWDAGNSLTGSFNNDIPIVKFVGTCSASSFDEKTLTVTATSLLNMTQQQMPPIRIQPLCSWNFPPSDEAQADGLLNHDSPYFECAYSPTQAGGVGNYESGTASFTSCPLSRAACIARLGNASGSNPIMADTLGRETGHFGGYDYMPNQNNGLQRSYVTGQWDLIVNATNEAKYGDYIPVCYGTTWVQPEVMGVYGDGNYTRFESLLCFGVVQEIILNVVAGVVVAQYLTSSARQITSPGFTSKATDNNWTSINNGSRNGNTNPNIGWANKGDPYGSVSSIFTQVLSTLSSPSSIPQSQVLLTAGQVFVASGTVGGMDYVESYEFSSNPAWILLDLLIQANWRYSEVNIQSFIDAAAICDEQIFFNRLDGTYADVYNEVGSPEYSRYSVGFTIKQRTSIGEVIRGVRNAMRGMLFFDFNSGLLTLQCKSTIAEQQPNKITGSNYNSPVSSVNSGGGIASGYVAYHFDENSIRKTDDGKSTLRLYQKQFQETPNKVTTYFFDRENQYNQDISTLIDVEDVNRIGSEIAGTFNLTGPQTYDHINRVTATWFAENYRGNPRLDFEGSAIGDTGGTIMAEFETSVKALHLMVGHIVLLSDAQTGLSMQPFRVMKIQPDQNFETAKVTIQWHNDNWYQDTFGQGENQPIYKSTLNAVDRPPYPFRAGALQVLGSPYYDTTEMFYNLSIFYGANNSSIPFPSCLIVGGYFPPNSFQSTPRMPKLAITGEAGSGGIYPDNSSYFSSVASSSKTASFSLFSTQNDLLLSALSNVASVFLPTGFNTPEYAAQAWPDSPESYFVFAGSSEETMTLQYSKLGTPPSGLSLSGAFKVAAQGAPDVGYNSFRLMGRSVELSGICSLEFTTTASFSGTTATIQLAMLDGVSFPTNFLAGREISYIGGDSPVNNGGGPTSDDILDLTIVDNSASAIHVTTSDPTELPIIIALINGGEVSSYFTKNVWAVRLLPTFGTDSTGNYFEDSSITNVAAPISVKCIVTAATNATPIRITVDDSSTIANGQDVVLQGVLGNTAANGAWTLGGVSGNTAQLVGSVGNGTFSGNGILFDQGFSNLSSVQNMSAFIFAGTGRNTSAKLGSTSGNRFYIQGDWPIEPDSTSRIILIDSSYVLDQATAQISVSLFGNYATMNCDISNLPKNKSLLFQPAKQSAQGLLSSPLLDQYRELYISNQYLFDGSVVVAQPANTPGATNRTLTIYDTTAGTNISPVSTVQIAGLAQSVQAVLRTAITANLVVRINLNGSPIITCTLPSSTPVQTTVLFTSFVSTPQSMPLNGVLSCDILSSDGSKDKNGVATFTIVW